MGLSLSLLSSAYWIIDILFITFYHLFQVDCLAFSVFSLISFFLRCIHWLPYIVHFHLGVFVFSVLFLRQFLGAPKLFKICFLEIPSEIDFSLKRHLQKNLQPPFSDNRICNPPFSGSKNMWPPSTFLQPSLQSHKCDFPKIIVCLRFI